MISLILFESIILVKHIHEVMPYFKQKSNIISDFMWDDEPYHAITPKSTLSKDNSNAKQDMRVCIIFNLGKVKMT